MHQPNAPTPETAFDAGVRHHQAGRLEEAIACYERHLADHDTDGPAWSNLGTALKALGHFDEALDAYMRALGCEPGNADTLYNVGTVFQAQGLFKQAIDGYRRALAIDPRHERAYYSRGICHLYLDDPASAVSDFRSALAINAANLAVWINLGTTLRRLNKPAEAAEAYRRALQLSPDQAITLQSLGEVLMEMGQYAAAYETLEHARHVAPDVAINHLNAAVCCSHLGRRAEFRQRLVPLVTDPEVGRTAAILLIEDHEAEGDLEGADELFVRLFGETPDRGLQVNRAMLRRVIPRSADDARAMMDRAMALLDRAITGAEPRGEVTRATFAYAFYGLPDRELQRRYAQALAANYPELVADGPWVATWADRPPPSERRIRVGIISHFFQSQEHIVWHAFGLMAERFDRRRFEVVLLIPGPGPIHPDLWQYADDVRCLPGENAMAVARQVADCDLDALIYTDIGMEVSTYQLGLARLAPVQLVMGGHPVSTGLPHMDYVVSTGWFEADDAQDHYTEQLILLKDIYMRFARPAAVPPLDLRARLGLDAGTTVYGCLQSIFKLNPDYDAALAAILEGDPTGVVVLVDSALSPQWLARFAGRYGHLEQRVHFMPRLSFPEFCGALQACDALLDPFFFNGGTTTFTAFAAGSPIVTLPGPYLRGRCALGLYRLMGIPDLIAADLQDYVAKAIRLAHDKDWAQSLRERILASADPIFDCTGGVDELAEFLVVAVEAARRGERVTRWPA